MDRLCRNPRCAAWLPSTKRADAKWCSHRCKVAAARDRRRQAEQLLIAQHKAVTAGDQAELERIQCEAARLFG
ncbi:hypothetical protein [Streptomyces chilikensis]|uniref:hypothetical protein n=1 Tax=Streptomyces chilikensis TaxID=1194079 RepID=UPI000ADFB2FD|nr:hypothetical protein [Streptomyces chilikensis]